MILRPYQQTAINSIRAAYKAGNTRVCLTMPTGSGKTVCFAYIAKCAAEKGNSVLIVAHRTELIEQISDTLDDFGVEHGTILAGEPHTDHRIQVGMLLTTGKRLDRINPDLIITDECHRSSSDSYKKIFDAFSKSHLLGVTATPARTDGTGLKAVFQKLVIGPTTRELIDAGHLAPYRIFCPPSKIDLTGIKMVAGDYNQGDLAQRTDKSEITGDAVSHYKKLCPGKQFVVFCTSRLHAQNVATLFTTSGISCANIDGSMNKDKRKSIIGALRSGELLGVSSCDLISEGFDLPAITAAILLRPTQSLIIYLQQVGRALRPVPGKTAIILDHSSNCLKHGMPDQYREWTLEGAKKIKKTAIRVRQCKECFAIFPVHILKCPECGAESEKKSRLLNIVDGELFEISPLEQKEERVKTMPYKVALAECWNASDILFMARAKGYKPGWAIKQVMVLDDCDKWDAAERLGYERSFANYVGD